MIYLASQSPRRQELLDQVCVVYQQIHVEVDESVLDSETPAAYVQRVALAKAQAGWQQVTKKYPVLGADTSVVCDGQILGKPRDTDHAAQMLNLLSNRQHQVLSAVALVNGEHEQVVLSISEVTFRLLTTKEIQAYIATGEPLDKAGAYAIQGRAAVFIANLNGSYSGVMGLPLFETAQLLKSSTPLNLF